MPVLHIDDAIDYTDAASSHPSYRYSKVLPNGNQSISLTSSTQDVLYDIPAEVFNNEHSFIQQDVLITGTLDQNLYLHTQPGSFVNKMVLQTRSGVDICNIPNFSRYVRQVCGAVTKLDDFLTNDSNGTDNADGPTPATIAAVVDKGNLFYRSANPALAVATVSQSRQAVRLSATGAGELPDLSFDEQSYIMSEGAAADSHAAKNTALKLVIDFKLAYHTAMSSNMDMFFNQALVLRVTYNSKDMIGWEGSSATVPATGAQVITGAVAISNMSVMLAVETNQKIRETLMHQVRTNGMVLRLPYVYSYSQPVDVSTANSYTQKINRGHGSSLLNVYYSLHHTSQILNQATNISNIGAAKITSFYDQLDSKNLSENSPMSCAASEDYDEVKRLIKGSVVQSNNIWKSNRNWIRSWRAKPTCEWLKNDSVADGLDLSSEVTYTMYNTTPSLASFHDVYFIVQRDLHIEPSGLIYWS